MVDKEMIDSLSRESLFEDEEPYSPLIDVIEPKPKHLLLTTTLHNIIFRSYDNSLGYTIVSSITPWKKDLVSILTILIKSDVAIEWRNYIQPEFIFSKNELWVHNNNILRAKWSLLNGTYKSRILIGNIYIGKLAEWKSDGEFIPDVILIPKTCYKYRNTLMTKIPNAIIEYIEPSDTPYKFDLMSLGGTNVIGSSMLDYKLILSKNIITTWLIQKE
jgi:hypothetical protein